MDGSEVVIQRIDNILYGPKVDLPTVEKGLGRTVFDYMSKYKDRIFQIHAIDDHQESYEEVNQKLIRIALEMRHRGIKKDDIIMMCCGNKMDAVLPVYSTLYLNAVSTTLDPSLALRDCVHQLKAVAPKLIFVEEIAIELIENALKQAQTDTEIIVMGIHSKYSTLSDFLKPQPNEDKFVPDDVDNLQDTSIILFSSGTTGMPKGICFSHTNMLNAIYSISETVVNMTTILCYTSFYWISAILLVTSKIFLGGRRLVAPKFTPETFLKYLNDYKVTFVFLASSYVLQLNDENTKNYKNDTLKDLRIGGGAVRAEKVRKMSKYFPTAGIFVVYGQTETGGLTCWFTKDSHALSKRKSASCGVPCSNVQLKIADLETGKALGPNQEGEIRVKANTLLSNYYNKDNEDIFDEDGFLKSGDVGWYDEDNCLYFSHRIKEMFKYQDWHIVPASVETVIYEHPAVLEAILIGIPHELDGHHPLALVILKGGTRITEEELLKFVNDRVLDREKLRAGLKVVKKFPRTCTGKVPRYVIQKMIISGDYTMLIDS